MVGQTDRHTHTHTHTFFLKHNFRIWEWYTIENHKKNRSRIFFTIAVLPSYLMSLESKNVPEHNTIKTN